MSNTSRELRAALDAIDERNPRELIVLLDRHPTLMTQTTDEKYPDTLLHYAAKDNDVVAVSILLERGADIERRTYATPLHSAAGFRAVESIALLIAAGADVNPGRGESGETAIGYAVLHGAHREADLLVKHGAPIDAFWTAAGVGDLDAIATYFREDGSLGASAWQGRVDQLAYGDYGVAPPEDTESPQFVLDEALIYAAANGRVHALADLVRRGANVNGMGYVGTALHWAIHGKSIPAVEFLLHAGADRSIRDRAFDGDGIGWAKHVEDEAMIRVLSRS